MSPGAVNANPVRTDPVPADLLPATPGPAVPANVDPLNADPLNADPLNADPYVAGHGDLRYAVRHYDLQLEYKPATNRLDGVATVEITALVDTPEVVLDLYNLHVGKITVSGRAPKRVRHSGSRLHVVPSRPLAAGSEATVRVPYSGKPRPMPGLNGRAGWEELTDGVLVGSQPYGAPSWFPCNDRSDDKATYRVTISAPSGYHVAGNGELTHRSERRGQTTWTFDEPDPMAPYLACVQIGRYKVTRHTAVPSSSRPVALEIVHPHGLHAGAGTAFAEQARMIEVFSDLFGPYPFSLYRAVIADDVLEIPLEAQELSSFGRNHVKAGWANERLVAHELAHQWFGNSLTVARLRDMWLHEGFACYSEWLWSEFSGGRPAAAHAQQHYDQLARSPQDLLLTDPGPELMFDDRVYKRGALALHVLRTTIGDTAFFALLRSWTAQNAYGLVDTDGFLVHVGGYASPLAEARLTPWLFEKALPSRP